MYEYGEYCDEDTKLREPQKLDLFREALEGTKEYTILLKLSHVHEWHLEKLQEKLRMKEIKRTPHRHKSVMAAKQRCQGNHSPSSENHSPKNASHKVVPKELHLPYDAYNHVDRSNPNYIKFRELVNLGKTDSAKRVRE